MGAMTSRSIPFSAPSPTDPHFLRRFPPRELPNTEFFPRRKHMDHKKLARAVAEDAALRRKQFLQPAGGKGDKIFPPTYPEERRGQGRRHVLERRRLDGREAWCVLVDSVQSQANRLEEALLAAVREKAVSLPYVTVDFKKAQLAGITEITSLDAPHRVYAAI